MARTQTAPAPSLDLLGTQAAIYPSEDRLWTQGPPIVNDTGPQFDGDPRDGTNPPYPTSLAAAQMTEDFIDEQMNGQTPNGAIYEDVVNPQVIGPQGYGAYNDAPFMSGHTQNIISNPSEEQGWGVGPARRWAHYPYMDLPNRARNANTHMRNGQLPWVTADSTLYQRSGLAWEQQFAPYKMRVPVNPVVPVPTSVPFVTTVPTYGGGDIPIAGVDQPIGGEEGIY